MEGEVENCPWLEEKGADAAAIVVVVVAVASGA